MISIKGGERNLENTNQIMEKGFFIGVYPGLTQSMLEFVIEKFYEYFGV